MERIVDDRKKVEAENLEPGQSYPVGGSHYKQMPIEPYYVMDKMGLLEYYLEAAAIKYILRSRWKDDRIMDLEKARAVILDLVRLLEKGMEVPF